MFWLTQKILNAYREEGFVGVEVFGPQGAGKTTYALKVAKQVYKHLGYKNSWEVALNHLYFDVKDSLVVLTEAYFTQKRIPVIIYDDAGVWLEKYSWQKSDLRLFARLYKLIRTLTAGVIFTTPSEGDLMKNVREKAWYKVKVVKNGHSRGVQRSKAKIFAFKLEVVNRQFKEVVVEKAEDEYLVKLPDHIYKVYLEKRKREGILPQLRGLLEEFPSVKQKVVEELSKKGIKINEEDLEPVETGAELSAETEEEEEGEEEIVEEEIEVEQGGGGD
ncbi:DnaA-like protein [Sulfolobales Mexican fusellovirus 1]|uniref:DnaA-like replication initiation protein n=1 Tax=Sulfolobales Mexican fusellovirus 1 TaxID=1298531 RepID=UPI0002C1257C|nr:DnaA-like replication initiation protein [Sulfolobales Mexican fusellovirus 1]AGG36555.1 DnaA-like protein [Sulfolobales Mexican fusellovirus 1]